MAAPSYYNDHNRNGLLKLKIELTCDGKRLAANRTPRFAVYPENVGAKGHLTSVSRKFFWTADCSVLP